MAFATGHQLQGGSSPSLKWWIGLLIPPMILCVPDQALANGNVLEAWLFVITSMFLGAVVSSVIRQAFVKFVMKDRGGLQGSRLPAYIFLDSGIMVFAF